MVATRSAASWTTSAEVGSTSRPADDSTVTGALTTSSTRPVTPRSCSDQPSASELIGIDGSQGRLDPKLAGHTTYRRRQLLGLGRGGQIQLGHQQVELTG